VNHNVAKKELLQPIDMVTETGEPVLVQQIIKEKPQKNQEDWVVIKNLLWEGRIYNIPGEESVYIPPRGTVKLPKKNVSFELRNAEKSGILEIRSEVS